MTTVSYSSTATGPLNTILSRLTYRPGWRLWVANDNHYNITSSAGLPVVTVLHVEAKVMDSNDHSATLLDHSFIVPGSVRKEDDFLAWVSYCLMEVERHEHREFFKVDGERFLDPHRDNNTRLYE